MLSHYWKGRKALFTPRCSKLLKHYSTKRETVPNTHGYTWMIVSNSFFAWKIFASPVSRSQSYSLWKRKNCGNLIQSYYSCATIFSVVESGHYVIDVMTMTMKIVPWAQKLKLCSRQHCLVVIIAVLYNFLPRF